MPDDNVMYTNAPDPAELPGAKTGDLKAARNQQNALTGRDRPKLSIVPYNGEVYAAAATTYGADKYQRGNYFGPPPNGVDPVDRFLEYIDAAKRHLGKIAQAINIAKGTGGDQRAACAAPDDESSSNFPASMLPHIAHAIAGLMIAVECGIADGLLPRDPGQPWKRDPQYLDVLARRGQAGAAFAQKDNPDAERDRVAKLASSSGDDVTPPVFAIGDRVHMTGMETTCKGTVTGLSLDRVVVDWDNGLTSGHIVGNLYHARDTGPAPEQAPPKTWPIGTRVKIGAGVRTGQTGTVVRTRGGGVGPFGVENISYGVRCATSFSVYYYSQNQLTEVP